MFYRNNLWHLLYFGTAEPAHTYENGEGNWIHVAAPSATAFVVTELEGSVSREIPRPPRQLQMNGHNGTQVSIVGWDGDWPIVRSEGGSIRNNKGRQQRQKL